MSQQPLTRLYVRIINKGDHGSHKACREMRVYVERSDGSQDRIGTLSASWGRIAVLRQILEAGARAVEVPVTITEPVRAAPGLG